MIAGLSLLVSACGSAYAVAPPSAAASTQRATPSSVSAGPLHGGDGAGGPEAAGAEPSAPALSALANTPEAVPSAEYPDVEMDDHADAEPEVDPAFSLALGKLSDEELTHLLAESPDALGGLSIGTPNAGVLVGGQRAPDDPHWKLVDPAHAYGTRETLDFLKRALDHVHQVLPGGHPLYIGHISAKSGGHLNPHKSHQAGRDVDISFFYADEKAARWYKRGTADNLDLPRTWAFVRALIAETDVDMILIDHSIQKLLYDYALGIGEDKAWLDDVFHGQPGKHRALILHAPGHATHLHIRFFNPIAQEAARRLYPKLVASGKISPPSQFVSYTAKKGDTLIKLAKRFGTSVRAIMRANRLRSTLIRAKVAYKIPKQVGVSLPPRVRIPARRPPPAARPPAAAAQLGAPSKSNAARSQQAASSSPGRTL